MRGHGAVVASGSIRQAVFVSVYLERNAILQMQAMAMGRIKFLSKGEVDAGSPAPVLIRSIAPGTLSRGGPGGRRWDKLAHHSIDLMSDEKVG
jgi:hypothetical protein